MTPVHVGSGARLNHFDGCYEAGRWWRIDLDRVLEHNGNAQALAEEMRERGFRWADWLRRNGLRPAEVSSYSVECRMDPRELEIRETVKDVQQRPYLPGSSLKGALRTALLSWLLDQSDDARQGLTDFLLREIRSERKPEPRFLARALEEELFGREPNTDVLRALHVTDSAPCAGEELLLSEATTYSLNGEKLAPKKEPGADFRSFAECLRPRATLQTSLGRDQFLFTRDARRQLKFNESQETALKTLPNICNDFASDLLLRERDFYDDHSLKQLDDECERLEKLIDDLPPGAFLLNLGWGGGWESKTVGDIVYGLLGKDSFVDLRRRFRLGKHPNKPLEPYLKMYFPHSRQLATVNGQVLPFGWVKLEVSRETNNN
jgi:CRISPR-associated protein Csm5